MACPRHHHTQRQQLDPGEEISTDTAIVIDPEEYNNPSTSRKRKLQQVSTKQAQVRIIKWIIEDEKVNGMKGLFARAICAYSGYFVGSQQANSMKARRWWKQGKTILSVDKNNKLSDNHRQGGKPKKVWTKAAPGRAPKRE